MYQTGYCVTENAPLMGLAGAVNHVLNLLSQQIKDETTFLLSSPCHSHRVREFVRFRLYAAVQVSCNRAFLVIRRRHGHGHGHGRFIKTSTRDDKRLNGLNKTVTSG